MRVVQGSEFRVWVDYYDLEHETRNPEQSTQIMRILLLILLLLHGLIQPDRFRA